MSAADALTMRNKTIATPTRIAVAAGLAVRFSVPGPLTPAPASVRPVPASPAPAARTATTAPPAVASAAPAALPGPRMDPNTKFGDADAVFDQIGFEVKLKGCAKQTTASVTCDFTVTNKGADRSVGVNGGFGVVDEKGQVVPGTSFQFAGGSRNWSQTVAGVTAKAHFTYGGVMREGVGEIQLTFSADLPGGGHNRRIVFENHHQSKISAYLVNCLVPSDPDLRIVGQNRDPLQSFYQVEVSSLAFWFHGFGSMFHLGVQHIAEGTDHLLFLLTLLLPAPLIAVGSRWGGFAGARHCLVRSLKVVTAFTLGHSVTLALAALGVVHVPIRPIEVLVALSILVSAVHALRPLLPGREAGIAAFFGLIHGLAFASTLGSLGLEWQERVVSLLGFNMGIEAMQLMVVAATLPSLVLLGVTRAYSMFRIGGALFAVFASAGWIAERLLQVHTPVDALVNEVAGHAVWIAVVLFVISLSCWLVQNRGERQSVAPAIS